MNSWGLRKIFLGKPLVGLPIFVCAFAFAVFLAQMFWKLPLSQSYPDFVIGSITWTAESKSVDYYAAFAFFITFPVCLLLGNILLHVLAKRQQYQNLVRICSSNTISPSLLVFLVGILQLEWWILAQLINSLPPTGYLIFSCIWTLLFVVALRSEKFISPGKPIVAAALTLFVSYIFCLAIATTVVRLFPGYPKIAILVRGFIWLFPSILTIVSLYVSIYEDTFAVKFHNFTLSWMQIFIPLLLLVFFPVDGVLPVSLPLLLLIGSLITVCVVSVYRWCLNLWQINHDVNFTSLIHSTSLLSFLLYENASGYRTSYFLGDDFHIGEWLLPWQQLISFGKLPFVDLNYPHGFIHLIQEFLNFLFFEGTPQTFYFADSLLKAIAVAATFYSLRAIIGLAAAAMITFAFPIMTDGALAFIGPAFAVLANSKLLNRPVAWLLTWIMFSYFLVIYRISSGTPFVIATLPVAVWVITRGMRDSWVRNRMLPGAFVAGLLILIIYRKFFNGFFLFLLENSSVHSIANGIPWRASPYGFIGLFSFVSFAVIFYVVWINCADGLQEQAASGPVFGLINLLFLVSISLYSLGRIDPESLSRYGQLSIWSLLFALPVVILLYRRGNRHLHLYTLAYIGLYIALRLVSAGNMFPPFSSRAIKAASIPVTTLLPVDNRIATNAESAKLDEILTIKKVFKSVLLPGETYLDFTNRSALYYYMDYPVPALEAAYYNAPATGTQLRMLSQLRRNTPPLILAKANNITHDGGSPALRSNLLYRFAVLSYVPMQVDSLIFLVEPERIKSVFPLYSKTYDTERRLRLLDESFAIKNLEKIPLAWGRSWETLAPLLQKVQDLKIKNGVVLETVKGAARGTEAAFLVFKVTCNLTSSNTPTVLEVFWDGDGSGNFYLHNQLSFFVEEGLHVIPVDAFPRWLLAEKITKMQVRTEEGFCRNVSISEPALYQRRSTTL